MTAQGLRREVRPFKTGELIDLAGNDYLGLRRHPAVVAGAVAAARRPTAAGPGRPGWSPGRSRSTNELERALCRLTGAPSALVLSTGYHANLAVLTLAGRPRDPHRLRRPRPRLHHRRRPPEPGPWPSAATTTSTTCARCSPTRSQPRAIVVVESLYSVLGDAAPLAPCDLAEEFDAVLVVDDAHGLGVVGERGEGGPRRPASPRATTSSSTVTLSKSLAAQGGAVLAHEAVRDHLVNTARPFIYDTGLAPAAAGAALGPSMSWPECPPPRRRAGQLRTARRSLWRRRTRWRGPVGHHAGPADALAAVAHAEQRGIRIGCFRPPSTPDGSSRLRLTAHADHGHHVLDHALEVLRELVAT